MQGKQMLGNINSFEIQGNNGIIRGIYGNKNTDITLVFVHGFERFGFEPKFRNLANNLDYNRLYFDQIGIGTSDGEYGIHTIETLTENVKKIVEFTKRNITGTIILVGHSLGCLLSLKHILDSDKSEQYKLVMIAPALNQPTLNRYRYACSKYKTPELTINWNNWKDHFKEEDYIKDKLTNPSLSKFTQLNSDYYASMEEINGEELLNKIDPNNIVTIFGEKDPTIPIESIDLNIFKNHIIIPNADHDMQKHGNNKEVLNAIKKFLNQ